MILVDNFAYLGASESWTRSSGVRGHRTGHGPRVGRPTPIGMNRLKGLQRRLG